MKSIKTILVVIGVLIGAAPWYLAHGDNGDDANATNGTGTERVFSQAKIEQMLAPIALYPDTVLSHLLIAATYPLEVVQAERWTQRHPGLQGAEAVAAVEDEDWDPSVKAMVAFPHILERMSEDLNWTQDLGDAFLLDEERVLFGIQELRQRAYAEGNLKTTEYVEVVREPNTIIVETRAPDVVYIPYYDSRVVYGPWHWPDYRPVYWHRPADYYWHSGFYWGPGIRVGHGFYFSSFHWGQRRTVVVHSHHHHPPPRFTSSRSIARHERARHWRHDPYHRRGVEYRQVRVHRNEGAPARIERRRATQGEAFRTVRPPASETRERLRSTAPRTEVQRVPSRVSPERAQRHEQRQEQARDRQTATESRQRPDRSNRAETRRSQRSESSQSVRQQRTQPQSAAPRAAPQRQQAPQRSQRPARQSMQHSPSSRRDSAASAAPRSAPASRSANQGPRRSRE